MTPTLNSPVPSASGHDAASSHDEEVNDRASTHPPFGLRRATEADRTFLWHLTATTMREYVAAVGVWDAAWQEADFRARYSPARWQVVTVEGRDAGGFALDRLPFALSLADIHLLPEYQRRGIGSAIMRALIGEAQSLGVPLALNVLSSNTAAQRLYERLGFVRCGPSLLPHCLVMIATLPVGQGGG